MSAVLLAVFNDYDAAQRVHVALIQDGFPTDRVELTACCDPGRAGLEPGDSRHARFAQYFRTLFGRTDERFYAEQLAERVEQGAAAVAVHPRGAVEIDRAIEILKQASPDDLAEHDLQSQRMERAAARRNVAWIRNLWVDLGPDIEGEAHCIYCRLFSRRSSRRRWSSEAISRAADDAPPTMNA